MAGILDGIMPAFLSRREPETPYSGNNGMLGLFGDGTASRLGMAGATLMNLANNQPYDTSKGLMAVNDAELKRKELERKYKSAMRYADKIQESNPDYAEQIRADWTLASFMQQEKLKHELDPLTPYRQSKLQSEADLDAAKVRELQNQEAMMQQFGFIPGAGAAPAAGAPSAVPGQASPLGATAGGAPTPDMPGGTPDTPVQPQVQTPQAPAADPFTAFAQRVSGLDDLQPEEVAQIKNAAFAAAMDNEKDMTKVNTAVKNIIEARRAKVTQSREDLEYQEGRASEVEKLARLRESGLYDANQLEVFAGNNKMLNEEFKRHTEKVSNPEYQSSYQLAKMLKGVPDEVARVMAGTPSMVQQLYQKQAETMSNPNSDAALRDRILGTPVEVKYELGQSPKVTMKDWKASPEDIRRLQDEFGLAPLTKQEARRIWNSPDGIAAEAEKVRNEQRSDTKDKTQLAKKMNDDHKKAKQKNAEVKALAEETADQLANGNLTEEALADNPAAGMGLLYRYIKALDPDSAVREGEMALANQMTRFTEDWMNKFNKLGVVVDENGKIANPHVIPPRVARQMAMEIVRMGSVADQRLTEIDAEYSDLAQTYGVDPGMVVNKPNEPGNYDPGSKEFYEERQGQTAPVTSSEEADKVRREVVRKQGPQSNTPWD